MREGTIEEYRDEPGASPDDECPELHEQFPYVAVVEGDYPEFDFAVRWCWQNFGPQHGPCWGASQYPACPFVLETEHRQVRKFPNQQIEIKAYKPVPQHTHAGNWSIYFLGKTAYDHGYGAFCFSTEMQREAFRQQVPDFGWGENYPPSKDESKP